MAVFLWETGAIYNARNYYIFGIFGAVAGQEREDCVTTFGYSIKLK